mgnify:CR=1 FL=1
MIVNFKMKNYGPFKEEVILDFSKKSKEKKNQNCIKKMNNQELLNSISLNPDNKAYLHFTQNLLCFQENLRLQSLAQKKIAH